MRAQRPQAYTHSCTFMFMFVCLCHMVNSSPWNLISMKIHVQLYDIFAILHENSCKVEWLFHYLTKSSLKGLCGGLWTATVSRWQRRQQTTTVDGDSGRWMVVAANDLGGGGRCEIAIKPCIQISCNIATHFILLRKMAKKPHNCTWI